MRAQQSRAPSVCVYKSYKTADVGAVVKTKKAKDDILTLYESQKFHLCALDSLAVIIYSNWYAHNGASHVKNFFWFIFTNFTALEMIFCWFLVFIHQFKNCWTKLIKNRVHLLKCFKQFAQSGLKLFPTNNWLSRYIRVAPDRNKSVLLTLHLRLCFRSA